MQLQELERRRLKLYKDHLRRDMQFRNQRQQAQKNEVLQRENQQIHEIMNKVKEEDIQKKIERRRIANSLNQDNQKIKHMRQTNFQYQSPENEHSKNYMIKRIIDEDGMRASKLRQTFVQQLNQNHIQDQYRKVYGERIKQLDKAQQEKHLRKVQQDHQRSINNYHDLIKKHSQDMNIFEKQKQYTHMGEKYKDENIRKFEDKDQIFAHVKRNQTDVRKKIYHGVQQQIKKQMEEFNQRKSIEKIDSKTGNDDLQKSMLGSVLLRQPKNYSLYYNDLKNQMSERTSKDSIEKIQRKQKVQINNIFGGRPTGERLKQLNYIDHKMGLRNDQMTPNRMPSPSNRYAQGGVPVNNGLNQQKAEQINRQKLNKSQQEIPQSYESHQIEQYKLRNPYPTDPGVYRSQSLEKPPEAKQQQSIKRQDGSGQSQRSKKAYLTYDLITGTNKYYEDRGQ